MRNLHDAKDNSLHITHVWMICLECGHWITVQCTLYSVHSISSIAIYYNHKNNCCAKTTAAQKQLLRKNNCCAKTTAAQKQLLRKNNCCAKWSCASYHSMRGLYSLTVVFWRLLISMSAFTDLKNFCLNAFLIKSQFFPDKICRAWFLSLR